MDRSHQTTMALAKTGDCFWRACWIGNLVEG
jgi:hypothetical protein